MYALVLQVAFRAGGPHGGPPLHVAPQSLFNDEAANKSAGASDKYFVHIILFVVLLWGGGGGHILSVNLQRFDVQVHVGVWPEVLAQPVLNGSGVCVRLV